ncbi:hypothetical protein BCEP4_510093 [Burkholderia cepacia]|nr:hypothetical protein BCEP4_510093 [Burkholderia cepacia]
MKANFKRIYAPTGHVERFQRVNARLWARRVQTGDSWIECAPIQNINFGKTLARDMLRSSYPNGSCAGYSSEKSGRNMNMNRPDLTSRLFRG